MLGIPIEDFENFRSPDPNDRAFCSKQDRVKLWLDKLRERAKHKEFSFPYHSLFDMTSNMMSNNPDDRPTAKEVHSTFPPNSCVDVPGEGPMLRLTRSCCQEPQELTELSDRMIQPGRMS